MPQNLGGMSVLIVDDSVLSRRMMRRTLRQRGIGASVEEAGDGLELLSLLCPQETVIQTHLLGLVLFLTLTATTALLMSSPTT
jgi:CheY-like chemotaxis protein